MGLENIKWGNPGPEIQPQHDLSHMWTLASSFYVCMWEWVWVRAKKLEKKAHELYKWGFKLEEVVEHVWCETGKGNGDSRKV